MIAIKGMEIPTSCKECMLNNVDSPWFGLCRTTGNNVIEYKDSRHPNCPLVEIVNCKECANYDKGGALCSNINCIEYRLVLERQKAKGERKKVR